MKRRDFLKVAGAGMATSAVAAPAIAQSMPEVRWRLTASWPKSLDTLYGSCETFSKYVAEATDNKFQVQSFAAGEIVPGLQVLDAVQNGTVEVCHTATYYFIGKDPTWALFCAVPFGLNTRQQNAWYYDGGWPQADERVRQEVQRATRWSAGNTGAQMGGWFRKEIKTVDDLKGLKFRIGGWAGKTLQKLGVVPAADCGRRHLPGAGERHHRCRRMGRSLRRREARFLQGRAVSTTIPVGGRAAPRTTS